MLAIGPTRASAFVGEELVVKPASPPTLTEPAKTIISKPTFITTNVSEAALGKGVAEASRAAAVWQAAGVLPALGSVVAFGVGAAIGSEICGVLGIEGCWFHGSETADGTDGDANFEWIYRKNEGLHPYTWWWNRGSTRYKGVGGTPGDCGSTPGAGWSFFTDEGPSLCKAGPPEVWGTKAQLWRYSMQNRVLQYHASDDPSIPNFSHSAPADWADKAAAAMVGQDSTTPAGQVGEYIASQIEGSNVPNPYVNLVDVPNCDGLLWASCSDLIEEAGLSPQRDALDWQGAVIEKDAGAVLELAPAGGSEVEKGSTVTVTTNPDEAGMPLLVPQPQPGETYDEYVARLVPGLSPNRVNLPDTSLDPTKGPNEVVRTYPQPETRLDPQTSHQVEVQTNPPTAPSPAPVAWSPPEISGIDLGPLSQISIGCDKFPFGIFCWIGEGLAGQGAAGACPSIGVPFGESIGVDTELAFDSCMFEPAMVVIRPVLLLVSALGVAFLFAASALGFSGGGSED